MVYQRAILELLDKILYATNPSRWEDLGVIMNGEAAWLPVTAEEWDTLNVLMDDFPAMEYSIPYLDVFGAWVLIPDKREENGNHYFSLMVRNGCVDRQWAILLEFFINVYRNGDYNTIRLE
jgi:hypothetical protein